MKSVRFFIEILRIIVPLTVIVSCTGLEKKSGNTAPLKEYIMDKNEPFSYEMIDTIKGDTWTEFIVKMISGTWLTEKEVDETE